MINEYYSSSELVKVIKRKIGSEGIVELREFLQTSVAKQIFNDINGLAFSREERLMSHSYSYSTDPETLSKIAREILPFILDIVQIKDMDISILKMSHKDYILLHEDRHKLFVLELTEDWDDAWGGKIIFADGAGSSKDITTKHNSLILSNGKLRFFIKYINNKSRNKCKYMIIGRFK